MHIVTREERQAIEHETLADDASFSDESEGRQNSSYPDELRTEYQRDRDKIIHCKAFRRLSHKTQVFLAPMGDHYRTRLTHTLEVSQIARTISRALGLNEDLTEAISLGHDLGHTPFGHAGEDALCASLGSLMGMDGEASRTAHLFRHNVQSLRVVEVIENNGGGLNLTAEVRDGIVCHTGSQQAETLEGRVVALADRIAYVNHDIDDAIRAGILSEEDLPLAARRRLSESHSARIQTMVLDCVHTSQDLDDIRMGDDIWSAMMELRSFLFDRVYHAPEVLVEVQRAHHVVSGLFDHYLACIDEVPEEYRSLSDGDDSRAVVDFVAGMTDRYALSVYREIFMPHQFVR